MTRVPADAIRANTPASHGMYHAQASAIRPAIVAIFTNGETSRLAGMDSNGSSGSISTWIGKVSDCAAMVIASMSAIMSGSNRDRTSLIRPENSTMPNTADADNAKP